MRSARYSGSIWVFLNLSESYESYLSRAYFTILMWPVFGLQFNSELLGFDAGGGVEQISFEF